MDLKWPGLRSKINFEHPKWPIDLKWPEMRSKVIFAYPKWPPKKKNRYRSKMARNAIESDFRTSKTVHFVKNFNNKKFPYRSEMARNAIESEFRTSKLTDRSEITRNAIESEFHTKWPIDLKCDQTSKMDAGGHFVKIKKKSSISI